MLRRRFAALASIALVAAVLVLTVFTLGLDLVRLLVAGALLLVALFSAWLAVTRTGFLRGAAAALTLAAALAILTTGFLGGKRIVLVGLVRIPLLFAAWALARSAIRGGPRSLNPIAGKQVARAAHPVLLINPRSGGGKAERFQLTSACRARGIEPVVLSREDDLHALAVRAVERGADAIGMAGGDGSQATVAEVAASSDVAMVVVPAGTRNHLALDLGIDRDDVLGALDAFGDAVERRIDLAEVNGRVFVNNVSLGVYASIVRSPEYRDAKADTTLATLPRVLGPGSVPFDLAYVGADGTAHDGAHLLHVSNDPYGSESVTAMSRPRLDGHTLGIVALRIDGDRGAARFLSAVAAGHPEEYPGFASWTSPVFEVHSRAAIEAGVDGESVSLAPTLRFCTRPGALRIRLPRHAPSTSPAARIMGLGSSARELWRAAFGRSRAPA